MGVTGSSSIDGSSRSGTDCGDDTVAVKAVLQQCMPAVIALQLPVAAAIVYILLHVCVGPL
jgi:hypothetical protein